MMKKTKGDASRIVGRWRSPPRGWRDGEWGPSKFVMELKSSGEIKVKVTIKEDSPGGGGVISDEGTYSITDDTLTTDVITRGEPIKYEFKGEYLILTLPKEGDSASEVYEFIRE